MAVIGELLNIISHQWRQPLAQINAITLDMYMQQKQELLGEKELRNAITDIERTTHYLSNTIDDFSSFFVQEKEKAEFSAKEAIDACINILSPSLKDIKLEINLVQDKKINGYITLYQQVVLTLLTNSLDAFTSKNIENPKIFIRIDVKENSSYVSVLDNARGIVCENETKVFELYFSTKDEKKVSGLGLYIAQQIIEKNMDGSITLNNSSSGAEFVICI